MWLPWFVYDTDIPSGNIAMGKNQFLQDQLEGSAIFSMEIPKSPSPHDDQRYWATSKIGNS